MIIDGVVFCVMMLNAIPSKNGVSAYFSPREIMTRTKLDYNKHCKIPFGTYCQVFQDNTPSNTDAERTVDAICLGPTGNLQGSYKFFNLETRKRMIRSQFTPIPMSKAIIQRVERIAEREGQPEHLVWVAGNGKVIENQLNDIQVAGVGTPQAPNNQQPPQIQVNIPPNLFPIADDENNDDGMEGDADGDYGGPTAGVEDRIAGVHAGVPAGAQH